MKPETLNISQYTNLTLEELRQKQGIGYPAIPIRTAEEVEYWKKVRELPKTEEMIYTPRKIRHTIDYFELRRLLWDEIKNKLGQKHFQANEANTPLIQQMIRYFAGDLSCQWDLEKGLYLHGKNGHGKTFLLECFQHLCSKYKELEQRRFTMVNTQDIFSDLKENGASRINKYYAGSIALDDLGDEQPQVVKEWGNDVHYMKRILSKRYRRRFTGTTHVTTNLLPDELAELYGERIHDRSKEMFNFILFDAGESFRK